MSIVIHAENIGKHYRINHEQRTVGLSTLSDALANAGKEAWQTLRHPFARQGKNASQEDFWALKDICFEIDQGDRVGIIGRNGAGKSTLLKVLSRIVRPSTGRVTIEGRVASLLEVGTGFHPELTGRENVFLNGAILGMRKHEIRRKFDEIVDFAEVEKFLDTPVKHYSSGMYVRLAFAVAAHLEPEILIVDEVLAVGDSQFQKKCLNKMGEVGQEGRTVLFVSHNLAAIKAFCNKGLLLSQGRQVFSGQVNEACSLYSESNLSKWSTGLKSKNQPQLISISVHNQKDDSVEIFEEHDKCFLKIKVFTNGIKDVLFAFTIFNSDDVGIFSGISTDALEKIPFMYCEMKLELPIDILNPGPYRLEGVFCDSTTVYEKSDCFLSFMYLKSSAFDIQGNKSRGIFRIHKNWEITEANQ